MQKSPDYGAMLIRGVAGVVIFISLSLILLVVGNMIYTSVTDRAEYQQKVADPFGIILWTVSEASLTTQQPRLVQAPRQEGSCFYARYQRVK